MTDYRVVSRHPEDTADGQMFGPGETIQDLDLSIPHNLRLLEDGCVVALGPVKPPDPPSEPAVKKATELGVNIAEVQGTGKDGRVTVDDVTEAAREADAQEGDES